MYSQVRVIILNYLRWGNVNAIISALHPYCKITVINNLAGHNFSNENADVINNDSNKKCMVRWHATYDYPEPYKLILDDDILIVEISKGVNIRIKREFVNSLIDKEETSKS